MAMMSMRWGHPAAQGEALASGSMADFPQRGWCLGQDWLDGGLAAALEREGRGSIENVLYLPGRWLQVVYRIDDGQRALLSFATPGAEAGAQPDAQARWLPQARAWAWLWPQDPAGLPLQRWTDPAWAGAQLRALEGPGPDRGAPALSCRVLSYLPGERCGVAWGHEGGAQAGWVMKGQRGSGATAEALHALWQAPGRSFGLPQPLGGTQADEGPFAHRWERFIAGERLESAALRVGWSPLLRSAAAALADLHGRRLPGLSVHDEAAALARLSGKVLQRITGAVPQLLPGCERVLARLAAQLPAPGPRATLHGDLHTGNLLVQDDGRIAFIDLDDLVEGAPAYDLALLASRLMLLGLLQPQLAAELAQPLRDWPRWYIEAGGDARALAAYPWYLALLLLSRQVKTCIRHAAPDLGRLAVGLLRQAGAVLDEAGL